MKPLRLTGWALALLLPAGQGAAADAAQPMQPTAVEIARNVEQVNRFRSVRDLSYGTGKQRMVVVDRPPGQGIRVNTLQRYRNNDYAGGEVAARDLVIFRGGKLRGTGILVSDHMDPQRSSSYVIWMPSIRKLRRFAEPKQADTWSGSNFTYGDIYLRQAADETHRLLGIEPFPGCVEAMQIPQQQLGRHTRGAPEANCDLQGRETYRLESRPLDPDAGYDYRHTWVDPDSFADYRSDFFLDGKPLRSLYKDWRSMELTDPRAQYWAHWYVLSHNDGHEGMAFIDPAAVSWNDALEPKLWSEGALRRIKR